MADLPGTLGYLTVTGRGVIATADSSDVGDQPDMVMALANVRFEPTLSVSALVSLADDMFILPQKITATLNSDGRLVPPADGVSSAPSVSAPTHLQLLAPNQSSLNYTGWQWLATLTPIAPQNWQPFTCRFSGEPDEEVSLAQKIAAQAAATPGVLQALVYDVATTDEPFPDGYRIGVDLLLTPDNKLWSTSA